MGHYSILGSFHWDELQVQPNQADNLLSGCMHLFYETIPCVDMMTSSNGNIFRVTGHLCGEFTGPRWIPRTKASDVEFDAFFDMHPNKRLSKQ